MITHCGKILPSNFDWIPNFISLEVALCYLFILVCIVASYYHITFDQWLCTLFRWIHIDCERQNSGQTENHPREDFVCSNCRSPTPVRVLRAENMDTGPELCPQPVSTHTDSETDSQLAQKHMDLEPGIRLLPEMHNDPKPELLAAPSPSDQEPVEDGVLLEKPATSAQEPGGSHFRQNFHLLLNRGPQPPVRGPVS